MKIKSILKLICGMLFCLHGSTHAIAETATYAYDDAGRLIGVHYSGGKSISYLYDGAGNLLREVRTSLVDADGDGMDDSWENTHFNSLARQGLDDFDADGQNDLQEFMAGTNPKDDESLLVITQITTTPGLNFSIQWASVSGKYYRVQYNDSLLPSGWKNLGADFVASAALSSRTDSNVPGATKRFYRVIALF